ncbi:E3 ubiquitin-protein ligase MARCHF8 [Halotydeus destructor]|nr:E3 ubiquitin-protein ligase MARCHF8 [Halotydeus destructor]
MTLETDTQVTPIISDTEARLDNVQSELAVNVTLESNSSPTMCRICHSGDGDSYSLDSSSSSCGCRLSGSKVNIELISPCLCRGSMQYVHHHCLQQWIRTSNCKFCELCKFPFKLTIKYRPLFQWQKLEMSGDERKKLVYNLLFNIISLLCVFWSIYVLIEQAVLEAQNGLIDWPFWTKMLVISTGFLGGTIFFYYQMKFYFAIFIKWRQFNRIIMIVDYAEVNQSVLNDSVFNIDSVQLVKWTSNLDCSGVVTSK